MLYFSFKNKLTYFLIMKSPGNDWHTSVKRAQDPSVKGGL